MSKLKAKITYVCIDDILINVSIDWLLVVGCYNFFPFVLTERSLDCVSETSNEVNECIYEIHSTDRIKTYNTQIFCFLGLALYGCAKKSKNIHIKLTMK